jgi:hypothetical protein
MKVIYITPYLDEVERIITSCAERQFVQPDSRVGRGSKMRHLLQLISQNVNIASTHALFINIDNEFVRLLREKKYILILDEVFQTINRYNTFVANTTLQSVNDNDMKFFMEKGLISLNDDYQLEWNQENTLELYSTFIGMIQRGLLYYVNNRLLLWSFPIEVFRPGIFEEIYILTYRFESQIQYYYYSYFDLQYDKYYVVETEDGYDIRQGEMDETKWKEMLRERIHIFENERMNSFADSYLEYAKKQSAGYSRKYVENSKFIKSILSKTWYENNQEQYEVLRKHLQNFYKLIEGDASLRLWTCFKFNVNDLSNRKVTDKHWLASNARATNEYKDKTLLAYMINKYIDPFYLSFFKNKGIEVNQDEYAISEMLQWIFRSAIREEKDIYIYIPSERMRTLLKQFLNDEPLNF